MIIIIIYISYFTLAAQKEEVKAQKERGMGGMKDNILQSK